MILLDAVTISKSGKRILQNVSLELHDGDHWVIRGNNGVGKTVLLETIAGITVPTEGKVTYNFIQNNDWSTFYQERKEKIHYVSAHAMNNFLSGHHDLFYQQRYYDLDGHSVPLVRELLGEDAIQLDKIGFPAELEIHTLLNLEVTKLSNGQLKKLLLLKAFAKNIPRILLMDYPFEGLDVQSRVDLNKLIDHLANTHNVQVIIVDHDHELPSCINKMLTIHADGSLITQNRETISRSGSTRSSIEVSETGSDSSIVDLRHVSIRYGSKTILNDLTWSINKGERWALTGRNGCGKTTLFSLIYADHPLAYTQEIYLFGRRRGTGESIWDIKKRINYLGPEHLHYLNPKGIGLSGRNYIRSLHSLQDDSGITNLIEHFDASAFIDNPVRTLSSGDLQCLMLINFFLAEKELLLLDEPFQFLDRTRTDKLNDYLDKCLKPDTTLIMITHNEAEIRRWTRHRMRL
jgi:molybdate transport system ATP-binding protein